MRIIKDVAPRSDEYDFWIGALLILFVLASITSSMLIENLVLSNLLALVGIISIFVGIYQLRHHQDPPPPPVRPDFKDDDKGEEVDFGLKNYGSHPALYFQAVIKLNDEIISTIKPRQRPVHLESGEFVGFIYDSRVQNRIDEASLSPSSSEDKELELYYSYLSKNGIREPKNLDIDRDVDDDDILFPEITANDQKPRKMNVDRVLEICY